MSRRKQKHAVKRSFIVIVVNNPGTRLLGVFCAFSIRHTVLYLYMPAGRCPFFFIRHDLRYYI
jgi:hypothetical protein